MTDDMMMISISKKLILFQGCLFIWTAIASRYLSTHIEQTSLSTNQNYYATNELKMLESIPKWILSLKTFRNIAWVSIFFTAVNIFLYYQFTPLNYFQLFGMTPLDVHNSNFGLRLVHESRRNPELRDAYLVLRDANTRRMYELFGDTKVNTSSISGILMPYLPMYIVWLTLTLLVANSSRRFTQSIGTVIFLLLSIFVVDVGSKINLVSWMETKLNGIPLVSRLTISERCDILRFFGAPLLLSLVFVYYSSIYTDADLHMTKQLSELDQSISQWETSASNINEMILTASTIKNEDDDNKDNNDVEDSLQAQDTKTNEVRKRK